MELKSLVTGSWVIDPHRIFIETVQGGFMVGVPTTRSWRGLPCKHKWYLCKNRKEVSRLLSDKFDVGELLNIWRL